MLASKSLSIGNPCSGLVIELAIYTYVDEDLKEDKLKEALSSSRYTDNINLGSNILSDLNGMYKEIIKSTKWYN